MDSKRKCELLTSLLQETISLITDLTDCLSLCIERCDSIDNLNKSTDISTNEYKCLWLMERVQKKYQIQKLIKQLQHISLS